MARPRADLITPRVANGVSMAEHTARRYPTKGEIAQCAYQLYEARGRGDGRDIEDWLRAERALTRQYGAPEESNHEGEIAVLATLRKMQAH